MVRPLPTHWVSMTLLHPRATRCVNTQAQSFQGLLRSFGSSHPFRRFGKQWFHYEEGDDRHQSPRPVRDEYDFPISNRSYFFSVGDMRIARPQRTSNVQILLPGRRPRQVSVSPGEALSSVLMRIEPQFEFLLHSVTKWYEASGMESPSPVIENVYTYRVFDGMVFGGTPGPSGRGQPRGGRIPPK